MNMSNGNNDIWIGCTKQNMPSVYRALNALNKTYISQMWIWNSLINILPNDMFANVFLNNNMYILILFRFIQKLLVLKIHLLVLFERMLLIVLEKNC